MGKKVPNIAYILFKYGTLAKPFLNLILKEKIDRVWKHYFKAQKLEWQRDYTKALKEIEEGLNICKKNITLYYLLISEKIFTLKMLQNSKADELFIRLRKDYAKIPILARRITAPTLFGYFVSKYEDLKVQKIRFWSKEYKLDKSSYLFLLLAKARIEIKRKNLREGISIYFECFRIARRIPHPTGILACLNDSAWYLKERHPYISEGLAKYACYYLGWYREDIASGFFVLDTLLEIQKFTRDLAIFETINIINSIEKDLPREKGWGTREHYKNTIEFTNKFSINIKSKTYENLEEIREYLKNVTKFLKIYELSKITGITKTNLSAILKGKTKRIKDKTIRKFMEKLNLSIDIFASPLPFLTEYIKKEIEKNFKENIKRFLNLPKEEKILLFISTYMSLLRGKNFYLSRKNRLKEFFNLLFIDEKNFTESVRRDHNFMKFFNDMFNPTHPLFSARRELALNFLKELPKNRREELIRFYINLEEEDRKLIDTFVRNYVRYDRRWEVNVPSFKELEDFMEKFNLKKNPVSLALYYFDKESDMKKLISLLNKI